MTTQENKEIIIKELNALSNNAYMPHAVALARLGLDTLQGIKDNRNTLLSLGYTDQHIARMFMHNGSTNKINGLIKYTEKIQQAIPGMTNEHLATAQEYPNERLMSFLVKNSDKINAAIRNNVFTLDEYIKSVNITRPGYEDFRRLLGKTRNEIDSIDNDILKRFPHWVAYRNLGEFIDSMGPENRPIGHTQIQDTPAARNHVESNTVGNSNENAMQIDSVDEARQTKNTHNNEDSNGSDNMIIDEQGGLIEIYSWLKDNAGTSTQQAPVQQPLLFQGYQAQLGTYASDLVPQFPLIKVTPKTSN